MSVDERPIVHASSYYKNLPGENSLPAKIATYQRKRMFLHFAEKIGIDDRQTVIDVGVTSNESYGSDNYFEALYPFKSRVTAVGIEDASHLTKRYEGLEFVRIEPGPLPFDDGHFDVAHCSAVVEHVGSRQSQTDLVRELWRVSKKAVFLTTPNRWFPVEFHTVLPILHWLPAAWFRTILRKKGEKFYAMEENLNLLTPRELSVIAADAGIDKFVIDSVNLAGWPSNLMLIAFHECNFVQRCAEH